MDRWTSGDREAPEPLEGNIFATVAGLTAAWFVLFLVQLPFYGWYADRGHDWFIWTCLAGAGLGLIGLWYVRARETSIRRSAEAAGTGTTGTATTEAPPAADTPDAPTPGAPAPGASTGDAPAGDASAGDEPLPPGTR
ncbi:DUF2530 domain-containing protein [Streptomyces sp. 549]|uniref:DUF2530 domain-containing protein n=1 Tax=Streptomyces sp. 549 TaxID=3049076 RepID=UPI0024C2BCD7|nr:DUF2530 domain-containing protein [Streptomyces sp. 549]MDK1472528.1 DUF2530 domain-containing protein [Streptomyces sp. 549]